MRHLRLTIATVTLLTVGLMLGGCASPSSDSAAVDRGAGDSDGGPSADTAELAPLPSGPIPAALEGPEAANAASDRSLVITGSITITTDDPSIASERATEITLAAGGRVDARTEFAPRGGDAGSATLVIRIPADRLDEARTQLADLGTVEHTDLHSVDVGTTLRDLATRIGTLRASIARYTSWLADADTTSDLIELESAIAERQMELETLEAQQRQLDDQVAMSTITLQLNSPALAPPPDGPDSFWTGLVAGWTSFAAFWAGALVALGVGLPWLVLLGAAAVAIAVLARGARRRAQATDAGKPAAADGAPRSEEASGE